jgi:urease accessory protein
MITATIIIMTGIRMGDVTALLALAAFFSPSFPTGGFAYSSALETAVTQGSVKHAGDLRDWLDVQLAHGALRNDAILFAAAWRAAGDIAALRSVGELAEALCGSRERHDEAMNQGRAFREAVRHWLDEPAMPVPDLPLAVIAGAACAIKEIPLAEALPVFVQAQVSNLLQAAIRLSITGQQGATALLAELAPAIAALAFEAVGSTLDDLGSAALLADIAAINHETLGTRLFLS